MRKLFLLASASLAVAAPAEARDGQPYIGIEGGITFPRNQRGDVIVDYTTTQTPITPAAPAGPGDTRFNNVIGLDYRRGIDADAILGYDFGPVRVEGEFGYKRAKLDSYSIDGAFLTSLNGALNRPSAVPDPGAPGLGALTATNFNLDARANIYSGMLNALLELGNEDGLSFFAGGGAGRARVEFGGEKDNVWAYQLIAGARYAISDNIDFGLKYRYFQTDRLDLVDGSAVLLNGNPNRFVVNPTTPTIVDQTTNAALSTSFDQKFRSHSVLASLIFNFGRSEAPLPPPPPPSPPAPPPPPPAAPTTQTCPDGSVILASDACPVPPPAPPPPEVAPVRG